jgi:hypothetical protein
MQIRCISRAFFAAALGIALTAGIAQAQTEAPPDSADVQAHTAAPVQSTADVKIETDIAAAFKADSLLSTQPIGVFSKDGVVTLTGSVPSAALQMQAASDVQSIAGVTQVINNISVGAAPAAPATTADAAPTPAPDAAAAAAATAANNEAAVTAQNAQPPAEAAQDAGSQEQQSQDQNMGQQPPDQYGNQQGYPPQQPGYPPQYGGQYGGQYGQYSQPPRPATYDPGNRTVTLPPGTVINVRSLQNIVAGKTPANSAFTGVIAIDVYGDQGVVIPRGAAVTGVVVASKPGGAFKGGANLAVQMTSLQLGANSYPVQTTLWGRVTPGKGGQTAGSAIAGGIFGAMIGAIAGGGPGAAIGAASGAFVGTAASGASGRPQMYIPAEGIVTFRTTAPLTITTVPPDQARALAAAAPPLQAQQQPPRPRPYGYYPYGYYPQPVPVYAAPY